MPNKRIKKGMAVLLTLALAGSCVFSPTDSAKAKSVKKAALKTKKVSLKVGKKKKISIARKKSGAKYSFKASNKKISVNKKGVITAKKSGKSKVTVKEKYKKKTRKLGVVSVTIKKNSSPAKTESAPNSDSAAAPTPSSVPTATTKSVPLGDLLTPLPDATPTPSGTEPAPSETEQSSSNAPEPTTESPVDKVIYTNYFDDGNLNGMTARGTASLEISKEDNHTDGGQQCLLVTNRSGNWHGVQMDISSMVLTGSTYRFSVWVKQNSGAAAKISMKLDYADAAGEKHYDSILSDAATGLEVENDTWIELKGEIAIPEYSGTLMFYMEAPDSETMDFMIDDVTIQGEPAGQGGTENPGFAITDELYQTMKEDSIYSTGNNARIKNVIARAKAGEDVTLAYIGGSITEGALASPNSKCYAQVSAEAFGDKYGQNGGENVHYVNAGMSGTPSSLGIIRYDRDVLGQMTTGADHPDILFIEFAVNDYQECTNGGAYEGLIRRALKSGSAVVLVFSVFQSAAGGRVMETSYRPYGEYYDIPMISMWDSIQKYFTTDGFYKWYYGDTLHPNNTGHQLMADCIMNLMDKIDQEAAETDNIDSANLPEPKKTDSFTDIKMLEPNTDIASVDAVSSLEIGGFSGTDKNTGKFQYPYKGQTGQAWFPQNWMHTASSGEESFNATVHCKTLMIAYKLSSSKNTGSVDMYVDGEKVSSFSGYSASGWNNATQEVVFDEKTAADHVIEIKMASGDEAKEFTLLGLGYSE